MWLRAGNTLLNTAKLTRIYLRDNVSFADRDYSLVFEQDSKVVLALWFSIKEDAESALSQIEEALFHENGRGIKIGGVSYGDDQRC